MALKDISEEDIFRNATEYEDRNEQADYVKRACGNDTELCAAVEALLQHHYQSSILDAPALESSLLHDTTPITEGPGTVIGRYKLLEKIGEGGMAVVYMAEQHKPIRRKVALKIIKLGMDTKSVIARFEAERQALAMMDHPNIAKVLDAGATETGRPYFVMELVTGVSITEYCNKNNLSMKQRLILFIQVCYAVQHAHHKGIIHRDLKPTNVMVAQREGTPVPKVIDFGIAKATNQRLTERTLFTRYAHIIGTPAYMSPEQAELSELDIDTRTDVYSLGVLLYELLTGMTPFSEEELRKAGYIEMQRIIREEEPTKPSTKLSTLGETLTDVAKRRSSTPELLRKTIQGDLDWIVMKSLEKDRTRRYETASELVMDIQRHLDNEPVLAGSPSAGYRLRKFVRRNRVTVMTGLLVVAGLIIVAILSTMYAVEKEKARQKTAGLLARSHVDKAQTLCEQGEVGRGMLWLVESLRTASAGSSDLDRAVRRSLGAWYNQLHSLKAVVKYPDGIIAVTFSPDGSRILAACRDETARFCDATTGQLIGKPLHHGNEIQAAAISPDGTRIATGATDGSICLWDATTLKPVGSPFQHNLGAKRGPLMVFSPDSMRLITGGKDGTARIWDANTGKSLGKAFQYEGEGWANVVALAFCPEGLRVVLVLGKGNSWLGIYQMFDADRGEPIGPPVDPGAGAMDVAISPDGTRFATAKWHSLIQVWEAATGELAFEPIVKGGCTYSLAFSPDGSRLASGGNTRVACLWDATTGESIGAPLRQGSTVRAVAFSPDGMSLVTGNRDGVVQIWDIISDRYDGEPLTHEDKIIAAAYGPDGLRIVTETNGAVQIRNAATGMPIGKPLSNPGPIYSFAFSPDGRLMINNTSSDSHLRLWDITKGELLGESSQVLGSNISFSPDGSRILVGHRKGLVLLVDAATLKCLSELCHGRNIIHSSAFSPDGSQFLTGSYDGTTKLWDAATLEPIGEPMVGYTEVEDVAFNPDGSRILIGYADGTVQLRDARTRKTIGTLPEHMNLITSVAFSPDGSLILVCFMDRIAQLWDASTLQPVGPPLEHDCWWPMASFSPDGSEILVVNNYVTVTPVTPAVWRTPPGPIQGTYERITCWVQVVTGMELEPTGGINVLDVPTWQKRRELLQELGGPPESTSLGL